MLTSDSLYHFLLAGTCLSVCGSPVLQHPSASRSRDGSHADVSSRGLTLKPLGVSIHSDNNSHGKSGPSTFETRRRQEAARQKSTKKSHREALLISTRTRTQRDMEDISTHDEDAETNWTSSTERSNSSFGIKSPASSRAIPSPASPQTFMALPLLVNEGPILPTPPEPLLPDIEPNMMPKDDSTESLWTEAARSGGDTVAPPSQEDATEATMSSEALPLIFEPLEESATDGAHQAPPDNSLFPTAIMVTRGTPLSEADRELMVTTQAVKGTIQSATIQTADLADNDQITVATHLTVQKFRSGLDDRELEEDPDEENSEESMEEEESEEDLMETTKTSMTQPPYSLIPLPPVWVQRNQGLMRSWVALIKEKAGYVSGMLAPVGIGIAGALLIVGALYSVRRLQRKRRNSFKHQRRKGRQAEQPLEVGTSRQDQAMLLADSSEDEF
ncbi:armadillo-like helical domain-containing protein 4 [Nerophis ophidion]|uniref:armadillo-like helical domain-containing protein 4 n=1 Tax=Nerophis ophidion TaxID=159077 RepID=UPI002ADFFCD5|nr:armadillo-like helical domain-containing protein 4 [Nerophis ophidion]